MYSTPPKERLPTDIKVGQRPKDPEFCLIVTGKAGDKTAL